MVYITAIKRGLRIAGRIDQKYNVNKIFVNKYVPPGYRKYVNKIFDIAGLFSGGYGIYSAINSFIAPETPGNGAQIPFKNVVKTYKQNKTRFRSTVCYGPRYTRKKSTYRRRR